MSLHQFSLRTIIRRIRVTLFYFYFFQANPSVSSGGSGDKYTPLGALASLQPGAAQAQAAAASAQLAAQQAAASNQRGFPSSAAAAAAYQGAPHHFQQAGKTRRYKTFYNSFVGNTQSNVDFIAR